MKPILLLILSLVIVASFWPVVIALSVMSRKNKGRRTGDYPSATRKTK